MSCRIFIGQVYQARASDCLECSSRALLVVSAVSGKIVKFVENYTKCELFTPEEAAVPESVFNDPFERIDNGSTSTLRHRDGSLSLDRSGLEKLAGGTCRMDSLIQIQLRYWTFMSLNEELSSSPV